MAQVNAQTIGLVESFLNKINEQGINVISAYLFGSYARGAENKWSDIDVAIVSSDISEDNFEETVRLTKIACRIDNRIDPVPFRPEDFVDENPLVWEIKKDGIPIQQR